MVIGIKNMSVYAKRHLVASGSRASIRHAAAHAEANRISLLYLSARWPAQSNRPDVRQLDQRALRIAATAEHGFCRQRVLFSYPPASDFITASSAACMPNCVAVPKTYPPHRHRNVKIASTLSPPTRGRYPPEHFFRRSQFQSMIGPQK